MGRYPASGLCFSCTMPWTSRATSASSCSRLGGLVAVFSVAIVSLVASIGPPGSASEIAIPATNGARTIRRHSSSVKSLFVVTTSFPPDSRGEREHRSQSRPCAGRAATTSPHRGESGRVAPGSHLRGHRQHLVDDRVDIGVGGAVVGDAGPQHEAAAQGGVGQVHPTVAVDPVQDLGVLPVERWRVSAASSGSRPRDSGTSAIRSRDGLARRPVRASRRACLDVPGDGRPGRHPGRGSGARATASAPGPGGTARWSPRRTPRPRPGRRSARRRSRR